MIYVITGHYGSGKTEIAINLAMSLEDATVIDLDIVNPYFRSADAAKMLTERGVRVIAPQFANTNIDIPALPPEVVSALQGDGNVVVDVGGDDDGAIALGQYKAYFDTAPYEMYFVLNQKRPLTAKAEDVVPLLRSIETVSRIKVTKLINNTNVMGLTTATDVLAGQKLADEVSALTGIPVGAVSGRLEVIGGIDVNVPKMPLDLYMNLPWEVWNKWQR